MLERWEGKSGEGKVRRHPLDTEKGTRTFVMDEAVYKHTEDLSLQLIYVGKSFFKNILVGSATEKRGNGRKTMEQRND